MNKACPKCGITGDTAIVFGYRKVPHPIPQSWCRECRNKKEDTVEIVRTRNDSFTIHRINDHSYQGSTGVRLSEMTREELTILYCRWYPNDKANLKRSAKFMTDKLSKRMETMAHAIGQTS